MLIGNFEIPSNVKLTAKFKTRVEKVFIHYSLLTSVPGCGNKYVRIISSLWKQKELKK